MRFSQITSNDQVLHALTSMVNSGKVSHAILLHEDNGGGGIALVQAFLQYLYCANRTQTDSCGECPSCSKISKLIHPDVHWVFPVNSGTSLDNISEFRSLVISNPFFTEEDLQAALSIEGKNAMIKVDESKSLLERLSLSALERSWRSVVIYLPEKMNAEAANRLLKIIEEPPAKTIFLLVTHNPGSVLQTIASRCQRLRVMPFGQQQDRLSDPEIEMLFSELFSAICSRNLPSALSLVDALAALPSREKMKMFCAYAAAQLREVFLLQQGLTALCPEPGAKTRELSGSLPKKYARASVDSLTRAMKLIDRNVAPKILFTDLVDRLYMQF